jgi:hypothetical protein
LSSSALDEEKDKAEFEALMSRLQINVNESSSLSPSSYSNSPTSASATSALAASIALSCVECECSLLETPEGEDSPVLFYEQQGLSFHLFLCSTFFSLFNFLLVFLSVRLAVL